LTRANSFSLTYDKEMQAAGRHKSAMILKKGDRHVGALVAKYGDARLPRYTSYPTAPAFAATVGPDEYAQGLQAISASDPVSIYLHVPFCRSMCWYCGCHTTITRQDAPILEYLDVMSQEIELVSFAARNNVPVKNVHFGGGTPTIMKPHEFAALMMKLRAPFSSSTTPAWPSKSTRAHSRQK